MTKVGGEAELSLAGPDRRIAPTMAAMFDRAEMAKLLLERDAALVRRGDPPGLG
jgi:hypothetical protein